MKKDNNLLVRDLWLDTELTQKSVAEKLGVNERQVKYYLGGQRDTPDLFIFGLRSLGVNQKAAALATEYRGKAKRAKTPASRNAWNRAAGDIEALIDQN